MYDEECCGYVREKDAHPTRLQTSNDAQAVQRDAHLSDTKVETNSGNREEIHENRHYLSAIVSEKGDITRKAPWRSNPSQSQSEIPATNQGAVAKVLQEIVTAKENSSKVVDENGEPMVVYHGSRSNEKFYEFREYYEK